MSQLNRVGGKGTGAKSMRRRLPALIGGGFLLLFTIGVVLVIRDFIVNAEPHKKNKVQQISLVKPPPPKIEEKPPEPEKPPPEIKKEEVKLDQPKAPDEPKDQPPPTQSLGVDAAGEAGSDGFGLIGNKGGRDLLEGVAGGSRFGWYTNQMQQQIQREIAKSKKLQGEDFKAIVKIWVDSDGSVSRFELVKSSGNSAVDESLKLALSELPPMREQPPEDMPQPVKLRITSRL